MGQGRGRRILLTGVRRHWQTVLVGVLVLAVAIAAFLVPGFKTADVHLDEGSVFATRRTPAAIGQLNMEIASLSQGKLVADTGLELLQEGKDVFVRSEDAGLLQRWDVTTNQLGAPTMLPPNGQVQLRGGTLAVLSPLSGAVWYGSPEVVMGLDFARIEPVAKAGQNARMTVTSKGTVLLLSVSDNTIIRPSTDPKHPAKTIKLPFALGSEGEVELSAMGEKAVVLDRRTNQLWVEGDGHPVLLTGAPRAHLAAPTTGEVKLGGQTFKALVATPAGLLGVTGNGSLVNTAPGMPQADPIVPVTARGCYYGAFGGKVAVSCADSHRVVDIPNLPAKAELMLRVNRDDVVLNDLASGMMWLVDQDMRIVNNWEQVTNNKQQAPDQVETDMVDKAPIDRTKPNTPPTAKDDDLRVRAGRSTALPILDNDNDPDGDVLTVTKNPPVNIGAVSLVRGGTQVQFNAPGDAVGKVASFGYEISDGRGGTASAQAKVTIVSSDQKAANTAPKQRTDEPKYVPSGGRLQLRVLTDWRDPEGDDLFLVGAEMDGTDDQVSFTPDGLLTYQDVANADGRKVIKVTVSDGLATTQGTVTLRVQKDPGAPLANGDYVSTTVDAEVKVAPLLNDIGTPLVLSHVAKPVPAGPVVTANTTDGTFNFKANKAGTYYVEYTATTGPNSQGVVRVDVRERGNGNAAPIAVRDVALLPAGGSVLVDPLLNDEDPDGDVLALQSVTQDPRLQVEMSDRHLLQIRTITSNNEPIQLTYDVSDGRNTTQGTIVVMPATAAADVRPVALADDAVVRANDTVTVNVLKNDYSPAGAKLKLDTKLVENPGELAWVDGERVRFQAPSQPGTYRVVYRITDEFGREASSFVRCTVTALDAENRPPVPLTVTGRALAGTRTRIVVPLDGIDPNGDSVRLVGLASGPMLGRIAGIGERWLEYEAYPSSRGTDTFSYQVVDARGLRGTATMQVGVVPPGGSNSAPVAVEDTLAARPGRTVRIPLLANDSDPDGDQFSLLPEKITLQAGADKIDAKIVDDTDLEFTLPAKSGPVIGSYSIRDVRGAMSSANIRVDVSDTAPLLPPVVRDDLITADQVIGRNTVDVPVLANDYDPDADIAQTTISVPAYSCEAGTCAKAMDEAQQRTLGPKERTIEAIVGPQMKLVRYVATDADHNQAAAVLIVPGFADAVPALKPDVEEQTVVAGEAIDLDITKFVAGTQNRQVMLTAEQSIWASHGAAVSTSNRTLRFTAATNYVGPGSVVFEVTDGASVSDPDGRRAVMTIPIKILPRGKDAVTGNDGKGHVNSPPSVPALTLTLAAGEPETSLDVTTLANDPDGDQLRFERPQGALPPGVSVTWDGTRLSGRAEIDAAPGTKTRLTGVVKDGQGGECPLDVDVVVVPSTKPRAAVTDDVEPAADQGKPLTIAVLDNDVSPFPDKPLVVESVVVEAGVPSSGPSTDGKVVKVTPDGNFVGNMVLRYTVSDATKQPMRNVDGRIRITVRGVPSRPGVPMISDKSDMNRHLTINFEASIDNGAPIKGYQVTIIDSAGRTSQQMCQATTCTITGLTNGEKYTMSVVAINEVGESQPSGTSGVMVPDTRPGIVPQPTAERGDTLCHVSWNPPPNEGSAIDKYILKTSGPTTVAPLEVPGGVTSRDVGGLTNGGQYTFRVLAVNQTGMQSLADSDPSLECVPAGRPGTPTNISAADSGSAMGNHMTVSLTVPDINGDAIQYYWVSWGGDRNKLMATGGTGATVTGEVEVPNGVSTITVTAVNGVGEGSPSAPIDLRGGAVFGAPNTGSVEYLEEGNGQIAVKMSPPTEQGRPVTGYRVVNLDSGAPIGMLPASGGGRVTVPGLANGVPVRFKISACSGEGSNLKCDPSGASTPSAKPFNDSPPAPVWHYEAVAKGKNNAAEMRVVFDKTNGVFPGLEYQGVTFGDIYYSGAEQGQIGARSNGHACRDGCRPSDGGGRLSYSLSGTAERSSGSPALVEVVTKPIPIVWPVYVTRDGGGVQVTLRGFQGQAPTCQARDSANNPLGDAASGFTEGQAKQLTGDLANFSHVLCTVGSTVYRST